MTKEDEDDRQDDRDADGEQRGQRAVDAGDDRLLPGNRRVAAVTGLGCRRRLRRVAGAVAQRADESVSQEDDDRCGRDSTVGDGWGLNTEQSKPTPPTPDVAMEPVPLTTAS